MTEFAKWLVGLIKSLFQAVWDFIKDLFIELLDLVFTALLSIINAIPAPQFMTNGLSSALGAISSDVWFFASHFKLSQCFAVLGAAVAFRLARKAATLFQW